MVRGGLGCTYAFGDELSASLAAALGWHAPEKSDDWWIETHGLVETGGHVLEFLGRGDIDVIWRGKGGADLAAQLLHGVWVGAKEVG